MASFIYDVDVPKEIPDPEMLIDLTEQAVDIKKTPYEIFNEKNYEHYKKAGILKMYRAAHNKLNNCVIASPGLCPGPRRKVS